MFIKAGATDNIFGRMIMVMLADYDYKSVVHISWKLVHVVEDLDEV